MRGVGLCLVAAFAATCLLVGCATAGSGASNATIPMRTEAAATSTTDGVRTGSIPTLALYDVAALPAATRSAIDDWQHQDVGARGAGPRIPDSAHQFLGGSHVIRASRVERGNAVRGTGAVELWLDAAGTKAFSDFTEAHVDGTVAIASDGTVISAPTIAEPIQSGNVEISADAPAVDKLLSAVQTPQ